MPKRRNMTARVVPLRSREASDSRVGGTAEERLALVRELSLRLWQQTGQPLPRYTRREMPVTIKPLDELPTND